MKSKLLLSIFFFSLFWFTQTFALKIDFSDNQVYRPSQWIVDLWDLSVKIESGNEITKDKAFSLIIPDEAKFRFYSMQSPLVSGTWSSKVLTGSSVNPQMTILTFKVGDDLKIWDDLKISGLKLVIYDRQSTQNIGIDVNGDLQPDFSSSYYIRVNDILSYHDNLPPSEVFNFTGSLNENILTLSWDAPGDIDFQAFQIYTYDAAGNKLRDYFTFNLNKYTIDVPNNLSSIVVKTVDFRANYSTWYTLSIDYFKTPVVSGGVLTQTGLTSTSTAVTWTWSVAIVFVEKYLPTFKSVYYANFMTKFDAMIDKRGYKEEVRIVRNEIIKVIKDYEDKRIWKSFAISELKRLIVEFNAVK